MSTKMAQAENEVEESPSSFSEEPAASVWRKIGRIALWAYVFVFLLAITVQAVVLFLLWKWPSYDWGRLADRFVTSPAMAGLFAVLAAVIGAWSLNRQLKQTKEKSGDEAWWEQFEWVTDRIVPSAEDENETATTKKLTDRLPHSLAYDLITALTKSARVDFQKAAVAGIFKHYLTESSVPPEQNGTPSPDEQEMDSAEAESLRRALLAVLPKDDSVSRSRPVRMLEAYEYERTVQKALAHRFGPQHLEAPTQFGADATVELGSYKLLVEVKSSLKARPVFERTAERLLSLMAREDAAGAVIVTAPPSLKSIGSPLALERLRDLGNQGIHLIEWAPSEGSGALRDKIRNTLPATYR
ncbi:hypothetical protein WBN73_20815 [Paenarthrobacter sp. CCNWLY172]|uniref:hypothetical protein n=1 Tax=unclassified Paenarthrobacter TaxID=2634190 RepID=UPI0030779BC0